MKATLTLVVSDIVEGNVDGNDDAGDSVVFRRVSVRCRFHRDLSGVCPTCVFGCTPIIMGDIDDDRSFCGVAKLHETKCQVGWMAVTR